MKCKAKRIFKITYDTTQPSQVGASLTKITTDKSVFFVLEMEYTTAEPDNEWIPIFGRGLYGIDFHIPMFFVGYDIEGAIRWSLAEIDKFRKDLHLKMGDEQ